MKWRWIIRGVCVALLAVCVAAWVGSYFWGVSIDHDGRPRECGARLGCGALWFIDGITDDSITGKWSVSYWRYDANGRAVANGSYRGCAYHLAGFAYAPAGTVVVARVACVPMWFLTVVAGGSLGLVWRRTRAKYERPGFPVEVGGAVEERRSSGLPPGAGVKR